MHRSVAAQPTCNPKHERRAAPSHDAAPGNLAGTAGRASEIDFTLQDNFPDEGDS